MIWIDFFMLLWELAGKSTDCWAATGAADLYLITFDGLSAATSLSFGNSSCFHFSTLALLYLLQVPGCTVCVSPRGRWRGTRFRGCFLLKGTPFGYIPNLLDVFVSVVSGGEWSRYGSITRCTEKRLADWGSDWCWSQPSTAEVLMNGLANDVRPDLPTQKDLLTKSRNLWPKWFYLLYFIFMLTSYIYLKKIKNLQQCFRNMLFFIPNIYFWWK